MRTLRLAFCVGFLVHAVCAPARGSAQEIDWGAVDAADEEPRLFFTHFRANSDALELARELRRALDQTNSRPGAPR